MTIASPIADGTWCLVVDDDEAACNSLRKVLERLGYRVIEASGGEAALEAMRSQAVPVVITDIQMPGMDGVTLLGTIRREWPDVAVVVASGVSEVAVAVSCLQLGAMDYLTKPFQIDDVGARVAQSLDKRRLILENREYQRRLESVVRDQAVRIDELFIEGVQSLAHALDAKDSYTHGHSARVSAYAAAIARELGMSEAETIMTALGAELHDLGKIGVSEKVLRKPGPLSVDEYRHLMEHTVTGERILRAFLKNAPEALAIVRSHHERVDGKGLPDGICGNDLPLPVRIVTVADSFDAMTTARPYRSALSTERAVDELYRCSGSQFDPDVVEAFGRAYPSGTEFPLVAPPRLQGRVPRHVVGVGRISS